MFRNGLLHPYFNYKCLEMDNVIHTLVLDCTGSLHNKHFLTRDEQTKQVVT